jgi:two-component system nitrate/nitrite response regulator NarL
MPNRFTPAGSNDRAVAAHVPSGRVPILVADDHGFIRAGVDAVLHGSRFVVVAGAASSEETLDAIRDHDPAIVLLDLNMPGRGGVHVLETLRARGDRRKVVVLTAEIGDEDLTRLIAAGVEGIVFKDGAEDALIDVLETVTQGGRAIDPALLDRARVAASRPRIASLSELLTPREWLMATLVARGLRNREIGEQMTIGEGTVKVYLHAIYQKLGIDNRTELALLVVREGV